MSGSQLAGNFVGPGEQKASESVAGYWRAVLMRGLPKAASRVD